MAEPGVAGPVAGSYRLLGAAEVEAGFDRLAAGLQPLVRDGSCVLLGVLLGALPTLAALLARLDGDYLVDTCRVSRYRGTEAGGELQWLCRPQLELTGHHVIVIDDIHDDGTTLAAVVAACRGAGARRVSTAVLVERQRPAAGGGPARPDFAAFQVGPGYVFGCGMDVGGRYRHLRELYVLGPA